MCLGCLVSLDRATRKTFFFLNGHSSENCCMEVREADQHCLSYSDIHNQQHCNLARLLGPFAAPAFVFCFVVEKQALSSFRNFSDAISCGVTVHDQLQPPQSVDESEAHVHDHDHFGPWSGASNLNRGAAKLSSRADQESGTDAMSDASQPHKMTLRAGNTRCLRSVLEVISASRSPSEAADSIHKRRHRRKSEGPGNI